MLRLHMRNSNNRLQHILRVVVSLSSVLSAIVLLLVALSATFDSELLIAVMTVATTALVSVFSLLWQRSNEKRQIIEQQIREKKSPHYERLLEIAFSMLFAGKQVESEISSKTLSGKHARNNPADGFTDAITQLQKLTPNLISWADETVLTSWITFRKVAKDHKDQPIEVILAFDDLMRQIRKDLGHIDNLKRGRLLGM